MRALFLSLPGMLLGAAAAFSQPFSFGLKGGLPMTDFLNTAQSSISSLSFTSATNRYIVGPTAELRLPFGLGVEVDALYRHFNYAESGTIKGAATVLNATTTGNAWEFPLLVKYRFPGKIIRPYVVGGVAWDTLSGLTQAVTLTTGSGASKSNTSNPTELSNSTSRGFVLGAGISVKALVIHISPEVRYTRWGAQHFLDPNGGLSSNQNQAEFLLGITF
jgi:opacity protein-like surface antigen